MKATSEEAQNTRRRSHENFQEERKFQGQDREMLVRSEMTVFGGNVLSGLKDDVF